MTQNNEREAKVKLARLRFFRDLSDDERLKIFHIFGVLPDNYDGLMNLNIQSMLFDKWQAIAQSPISQNEQAKQIPDGWKLVPIEPTEEMIYNVDVEIGCGGYNNCGLVVEDKHAKEVYKAMINASPTNTEVI